MLAHRSAYLEAAKAKINFLSSSAILYIRKKPWCFYRKIVNEGLVRSQVTVITLNFQSQHIFFYSLLYYSLYYLPTILCLLLKE